MEQAVHAAGESEVEHKLTLWYLMDASGGALLSL